MTTGAGLDIETGIIFEQVLMQGTRLQVTYTEPSDRSNPDAILVRTLVLDVTTVPNEHREFIDALREVTEEGIRVKRNPPEQIFARELGEPGPEGEAS